MANETYDQEMKFKCNEKIRAMLLELPPYMEDFALSMDANKQPRTILGYVQDLYLFFRYLKERYKEIDDLQSVSADFLGELLPSDINRYLSWLDAYELDGRRYTNGNQGKKRKLMSLRKLYKFLEGEGLVRGNPATHVTTPKIKDPDADHIRIVSQDERERIFRYLTDIFKEAVQKAENEENPSARTRLAPALIKRDTAIIYMFLGTGLRISELTGLNVGNIQGETGQINIVRKGGKKDFIFASEDVLDMVRSYVNDGYREQIGADETAGDALFLSNAHKRMTPRSIERMVEKYVTILFGRDSGITPHKFRATFGTQFYENTHDLLATSVVMGNGVEIARKHYIRTGTQIRESMKDINVYGDE